MRAWCLKKNRKEDEEADGPRLPGMSQRYLEGETAILFGVDLAHFLGLPVIRRAEMMAHLILKRQRESYVQAKQEEWHKAKSRREKRKESPAGRQADMWGGKPKWML